MSKCIWLFLISAKADIDSLTSWRSLIGRANFVLFSSTKPNTSSILFLNLLFNSFPNNSFHAFISTLKANLSFSEKKTQTCLYGLSLTNCSYKKKKKNNKLLPIFIKVSFSLFSRVLSLLSVLLYVIQVLHVDRVYKSEAGNVALYILSSTRITIILWYIAWSCHFKHYGSSLIRSMLYTVGHPIV